MKTFHVTMWGIEWAQRGDFPYNFQSIVEADDPDHARKIARRRAMNLHDCEIIDVTTYEVTPTDE